MNSEVKGLLVSIIAIGLTAAIGTFNFTQVQETKNDVSDIAVSQNTNDDRFEELDKKISVVKKSIPEPQNLDKFFEADSKLFEKIVELRNDLNKTNMQLSAIQNELIIAKSAIRNVPQATPQEEAMFSLVLLRSDGNYVTNGEYKQNEIVYISGKYDGNAKKYDIEFKRAGQQVLSVTGLFMPTDGVFAYVFNTNFNQALGSYTATVTIDGKQDSIAFEIL